MREIDLHVHTTASDGTDAPDEVVRRAAALGLRAVAITDHDNVSGYARAFAAGIETGVEVVPGIEVSTKYGTAVHILGYFVENLVPLLEDVVNDRDKRNRKMVELMAADGLPVTYSEMKARFGNVIGRPHFGELLVEFGLARNMDDAFARFVGKGMKYYVPRAIIDIDSSVEAIVASGAVPVLAHPFQYKKNDTELRELIERCIDHGLRGIECRYSGYSSEQSGYLEKLAEEYGLLKTGGSDYHGSHKAHIALGSGIDGNLDVPYEWLERLKEAAGK